MYINFSEYKERYISLNENDINILDSFFNSQQIQDHIDTIELPRKRSLQNLRISIIINILCIIGLYIYLQRGGFNPGLFYLAIIISIIITIICAIKLSKDLDNYNIKNEILPAFVKMLNKDLNYKKDGSLFDQDIKTLSDLGIISGFDKIELIEDSISLNKDGNIKITGAEIKTTKGHKKNNIKDHCYITKIEISNIKYYIEKIIMVKNEGNKNFIQYQDENTKKDSIKGALLLSPIILLIVGLFAITVIIPLFIALLIAGKFIININSYQLTLVIGVITIIIILFKNHKKKNNINLENIEFEKEFEVSCEDSIQSRILLTPSFMYKLLNFTKKIDPNRKYEFYFYKNFIYIKLNLSYIGLNYGMYLDINNLKPLNDNIHLLIKFYIEIKNMLELTNDLNLHYMKTNDNLSS